MARPLRGRQNTAARVCLPQRCCRPGAYARPRDVCLETWATHSVWRRFNSLKQKGAPVESAHALGHANRLEPVSGTRQRTRRLIEPGSRFPRATPNAMRRNSQCMSNPTAPKRAMLIVTTLRRAGACKTPERGPCPALAEPHCCGFRWNDLETIATTPAVRHRVSLYGAYR